MRLRLSDWWYSGMKKLEIKPISDSVNVPSPVDAKQFFKVPLAAITAPTGGGTIDAESRTAINSIITTLENLGFITSN